jgi:hypothetical protein
MNKTCHIRIPGIICESEHYRENHPLIGFKPRGNIGGYMAWLHGIKNSLERDRKLAKAMKLMKALRP